MEISPRLPGLMVGSIVFLVLVFVISVAATFVTWRRSKSKKGPKPEKAEVRPRPPREPVVPVQEAAAPVLAPARETRPRPDEIMRVVYDERRERVLVEVGGERYAHIREIVDADVGKRVLWAIIDLIRFTGGVAAKPQAVRSAIGTQPPPMPGPTPQSTAPPPAVNVQAPAPVKGVQPAPAPVPKPTPQATPLVPVLDAEPDRQRYSIVGFFRRGFEQPTSTPAPSAGSFIDEIEEILQERIQNLPIPLPCTVHVLTGPDCSLQIEVGLDTYSSPDEVPDPEIRQLIKDAVAEWERR